MRIVSQAAFLGRVPEATSARRSSRLGFGLAALGLGLVAAFSVDAAFDVARGRRAVEANVHALVSLQRLTEALARDEALADGPIALEGLRAHASPEVRDAAQVALAQWSAADRRGAIPRVAAVVGALRRANAQQSEILGGLIDRLYVTVGLLVLVCGGAMVLLWRVEVATLALARLADERLAEAQREHAERLAGLHALAASTAHEVNNPLTAVVLNLEYLSMQATLTGPTADAVKACVDGTKRIAAIVAQLKTVAAPVPTAETALGAVIDSTLRLLEHRVSPRARVVQRLTERGTVRAEFVPLGQVVSNLVVNSLEAFGDRPPTENEIAIETRAVDAEWAELVVADNGPGFPPGAFATLLQPFHTTKATGSGLGLYVCKKIIEGFGGELALTPATGAGARIVVRLRRTG